MILPKRPGLQKSFVNNFLNAGHTFDTNEQFLKFQFHFFNIMLALAFTISPFIAVVHHILGFTTLFYSDLLFSITAFILILFLRRKKSHFDVASKIFIPALYITITLVFFLAGEDATKVIWAPILLACAFLLRGTIEGFLWLVGILSSYAIGYFTLSSEALYYSWHELVLIALSFITLSTIFNAFRVKNDADNTASNALNHSLKEQQHALSDLNQHLEDRIHTALEESENKTRILQHNLNIINKHLITISIDLEGVITQVSKAFYLLSGYHQTHYIGQSFKILFTSKTSLDTFETKWETRTKGNVFNLETACLNNNGDTYWLDMYIQEEFSHENKLIGYLCIAHNITNKKQLLIQQEQMLAQSRHAAMGEMIAMIAHQWRQPLTSISAIISNMQVDIDLESFPSKETQDQINRINLRVQHLSNTIDDFRDFFKPDKAKEMTYIMPLIEESIKLLSHRLDNDIEIIFTQRSNTLLELYHNEVLQVFINIINNACDAFLENETPSPKLWISELEDDERVIIKIQDNAGGIAPEVLEEIFDPYFSTKAKNGTGLGLYMSKTIIEEHQNGVLSAHNENNGVCFCIALPIKQVSA